MAPISAKPKLKVIEFDFTDIIPVSARKGDNLDELLDKSEKNQGLYEFLAEIVAPFGITDKEVIKRASKAGWKVYNNFKLMTTSGMSYKDALSYALQGKIFIQKDSKEYPISVAIISHSYNIYDNRASMNIFEKLNLKSSTILFEKYALFKSFLFGLSGKGKFFVFLLPFE